MITFRPSTSDEFGYNEVFVDNEYLIKDDSLEGKIVVDLGASFGFFVKIAFDNGAKYVDAYELEEKNYKTCLKNCENYNVSIHRNAVWRSDEPSSIKEFSVMPLSWFNNLSIDTTHRFDFHDDKYPSQSVETIGLDTIVDNIVEKFQENIYLLKIDVEWSEYDILYSSDRYEYIDNICGEWHHQINENGNIVDEERNCHSLMKFLEKNYSVFYDKMGRNGDIYDGWKNGRYGMFWASKQAKNSPFLVNFSTI